MTGCPGVRRRGFGREGGGRDGHHRRRRWRHHHHRRGDEGARDGRPASPSARWTRGRGRRPSATQLSSDPAPLTERSRPPGGARGGEPPPSRRGRVPRHPRASATRSPPGGTSLCDGAPRYGPREGVRKLTFRRKPHVGTAASRRRCALLARVADARVVLSPRAIRSTPLPFGTWTRAGAARGWGIIRSIRIPWVAPSRGAS